MTCSTEPARAAPSDNARTTTVSLICNRFNLNFAYSPPSVLFLVFSVKYFTGGRVRQHQPSGAAPQRTPRGARQGLSLPSTPPPASSPKTVTKTGLQSYLDLELDRHLCHKYTLHTILNSLCFLSVDLGGGWHLVDRMEGEGLEWATLLARSDRYFRLSLEGTCHWSSTPLDTPGFLLAIGSATLAAELDRLVPAPCRTKVAGAGCLLMCP